MIQDAARFPMVPTLTAPRGVKGHRPAVGTWACQHRLSVCAVVTRVTAAVQANLGDRPTGATQRAGQSKTRRLPPTGGTSGGWTRPPPTRGGCC